MEFVVWLQKTSLNRVNHNFLLDKIRRNTNNRKLTRIYRSAQSVWYFRHSKLIEKLKSYTILKILNWNYLQTIYLEELK